MLLRDLQASDRQALYNLLVGTGSFHGHEVAVAMELIDDRIAKGTASDYFFLVAEEDGKILGYCCHGRIPCTQASFDLYWIAVDRNLHGKGVGKRLMQAMESDIKKHGGTRVYIETSGRPDYIATRKFYEACAYTVVSTIPDFYAPGDDRLTYARIF